MEKIMINVSPCMAHQWVDKVIYNENQLVHFGLSGLSNITSLTTFFNNKPANDSMQIGEKPFRVFSYAKSYSDTQRAVRFFKGFALTVLTLGFGLLDRRVRNTWAAVAFGCVEKRVAISSSITGESLGKHAFSSFIKDPLGSISKAAQYAKKVVNSAVEKPYTHSHTFVPNFTHSATTFFPKHWNEDPWGSRF